MWYTGDWFEMSRYRLRASWTTRGLGQHAAVVQVDDRAVEREGLLDLAPVVFVGRQRVVGPAGRQASRGLDARRAVVAKGRDRRGAACSLEEAASRQHAGRLLQGGRKRWHNTRYRGC